MSEDADSFWKETAKELRKAKGFLPLSSEEAEEQLRAVREEILSDEEIDSIVGRVTSGQRQRERPPSEFDPVGEPEVEEVEEEVLQLNRNRGETDPKDVPLAITPDFAHRIINAIPNKGD